MIYLDVDAALAEVPVNLCPLTDSTDFKTVEDAVAYNAAGLALYWNFVTSAGAYTRTQVTPTTGGDYDWTHQGGGMYTIEIPASGGASINNDTEGYGWFTGVADGVLPWRGPTIGFRASGLNDLLTDLAYSTTRGLAGTALPNAASDAPGGLPISDAGGLDLDARLDAAISSRQPTIWSSASATVSLTGTTVATVTTLTGHTPQTGDAYAYLGTNLGAAGANATEAGGTGDHLTALPWNASWDVEVESEVTDALVAHNLDHLCLTATGSADMTSEIADNTILSRMLANGDTSAFDPSTDGLQPIRDRGDAAWITATGFSTLTQADIRTAVGLGSANLDTQLNTIYTNIGSALVHLTDIKGATFSGSTDSLEAIRDRGDAEWITATGFSTHSAADVWTNGTRTLTAATNITSTGSSVPITAGGLVSADVTAVSTDTEAADNLELMFDGTGYTATTAPATRSAVSFLTSLTQQLVPQITAVGATGNDTTHVHLPGITQGDDEIRDRLLLLYDAVEGEYHSRWIEAWDLSSELATVAALPFTPDQGDADTWTLLPFRRPVSGTATTNMETVFATDFASNYSTANAGWVTYPAGYYDPGQGSNQPFPDNFADLAITASTGRVTVGTNADKSGYSISGTITTLDALDTAQDSQHSATQSAVSTVSTNVSTLLNRLGAWTGTGINTLLGAFRALFRSDADVSVPSDINTDLGSGAGTAASSTDSLQAIRDNMGVAQTGDTYALASGASGFAAIKIDTAAILADTNELQTDWANGGRLDVILDASAAQFTTQMTESYNADGTAPTPAQALFVCMQRLTEFSISGTTITVKQLDGSTTAYTLTLDSTSPTSSTRAT